MIETKAVRNLTVSINSIRSVDAGNRTDPLIRALTDLDTCTTEDLDMILDDEFKNGAGEILGEPGDKLVLDIPEYEWHAVADQTFDGGFLGIDILQQVHREQARREGIEDVDDYTPLVVWNRDVHELVNAGLSRVQARVYYHKQQGLTHAEIGAKLNIEKGTVDTHSKRIQQKKREATTLLELIASDELAV